MQFNSSHRAIYSSAAKRYIFPATIFPQKLNYLEALSLSDGMGDFQVLLEGAVTVKVWPFVSNSKHASRRRSGDVRVCTCQTAELHPQGLL